MFLQEVYYARRSAYGLTLFAEAPVQGPYTRPAVPVVVENGVLVCKHHRTPLSICGCLDNENWPPRGQKNSGAAAAREEVAN
jgi:hypothetical protein